jgi:hypothetical protein
MFMFIHRRTTDFEIYSPFLFQKGFCGIEFYFITNSASSC